MSRFKLCTCSIVIISSVLAAYDANVDVNINLSENNSVESNKASRNEVLDDNIPEKANENTEGDTSIKVAEISDEDSEESFNLDEIKPEKNWNRYSGDSARTIKAWIKWWEYLFLDKAQEFDWILGLKLYIYPRNEVFRSLYVRGTYDPNTLVAIKNLINKGDVVLDIGANFGHTSLVMSRIVGNTGKVIALEPSSRDFNRLVDNISLNGLGEIIIPYKIAISDTENTVKLRIAPEERSALNTLGSNFSFKGIVNANVEEILATTIDKFIEDQGIDQFDRVDFIKLDIEGSGLKALSGAKNIIAKYRPIIMLGINKSALSLCNSDFSDLLTTLYELRYRIYKLTEEPELKFELISDLAELNNGIVFCMHETIVPPQLEQPQNVSILELIKNFFLK